MCSGNFRSRSKGPPGIRRTRKNVIVTTQKRITTKPTNSFRDEPDHERPALSVRCSWFAIRSFNAHRSSASRSADLLP